MKKIVLFVVLLALVASGVAQNTMQTTFSAPTTLNAWQAYSIPLTHTQFGVDQATFNSIMSSVSQIRIRTELSDGADFGALDVVKFGSILISHFNSGLDGWSAQGDGTISWVTSNGYDDSGYIKVSDWASGDWHWAVAPPAWSGDLRSAIGQNLEFYYQTDRHTASYTGLIEITSQAINRVVLSSSSYTLNPAGSAKLEIKLNKTFTTDVTVNLSSSNTDCITVPASVTIPAGATSNTVAVQASATARDGCYSVVTAAAFGFIESRVTIYVTGGTARPHGYLVSVQSIDIESFPVIKCFTTVIDSATSRPVTDLNSSHFKVLEDKVNESPIQTQLISSSSGGRADIVFVFDVTGSMGGQINGLKQKASDFADSLAKKGINYRLALVTYGDAVEDVHDFTSNLTEFKGWIEALRAHGGGDIKENSLEGLARAATLSFRETSQRMTILITDADYHEAGESGGGTTTYTTETMISLLNSYSIVNHVVAPDYSQFRDLASKTRGLFFDINKDDFRMIIQLIGEVLTSQYVVTYTTHNPVRDNIWRDVEIEVKKDSKGGRGANRYKVESALTTLTGFTVTVNGVNSELFPDVRCYVTVIEDASATTVSGLSSAHFKVQEDGVIESPLIVDILKLGSGARADIAFVFDVTGSMGGQINGLKRRCEAFADTLARRGVDYRLGLVTFGDAVENVHDFTHDIGVFKSWIDGLTASGGGDVKENALEGLARATRLSYRANSQRLVILITDADYHKAGESGGGTTLYNTSSIIELLKENALITNCVGPDIPEYRQIAEKTGGMYFNITGDFSAIIDRIGKLLTSQYVVTYRTHNAIPTGDWRKVVVAAEKEGKGGFGSGRYQVGSSRMTFHPLEIYGARNIEFSVDVLIESVVNLGLAHFFVSYNAAKLQVLSVMEGDFLKQGGATATFVPEIQPASNQVEITATRTGTMTGASGTGILCTVKFKALVDDCSGEIKLTGVDLRHPDNSPISVTIVGVKVSAVATTNLLGDFDLDKDIDTRDFALLASYWKPSNTATGDIGPATGVPPALTALPDGVVNFEDLFVFTRMWNWYHESLKSSSAALGKNALTGKWLAKGSDSPHSVRCEIIVDEIPRLSMGSVALSYDPNSLRLKNVNPGDLLSSNDFVFFQDHEPNLGRIDLAFARLASKGASAEVHARGSLVALEFERLNDTDSQVKVVTADMRNAENARIAMNDFPVVAIASSSVTSFDLAQNYPNPFNGQTEISFSVPKNVRVTITITNVLGQPVKILADRIFEQGIHRLQWDGTLSDGQAVVSGYYILRMEAGNFSQTRRMLFLK